MIQRIDEDEKRLLKEYRGLSYEARLQVLSFIHGISDAENRAAKQVREN